MLHAYARTGASSFRTFHTSTIATGADQQKPCLIAKLKMSKVADSSPASPENGHSVGRRLFKVTWRPDLNLPVEDKLLKAESSGEIVEHLTSKKRLYVL